MANPFLRTAEQLAKVNAQNIINQKHSAELYEPYAYAVVQQRENPPLAQKIYTTFTSALATAKEEKQKKQEYVSKQLFHRKELAEKVFMEGEDKNALLVNRTSPAIDYSPEAYKQLGYRPETLALEYPLSSIMKKFADSMRSKQGHSTFAGIKFKATTGPMEQQMLNDIQSASQEDFDKAIKHAGGQANAEFIKHMVG